MISTTAAACLGGCLAVKWASTNKSQVLQAPTGFLLGFSSINLTMNTSCPCQREASPMHYTATSMFLSAVGMLRVMWCTSAHIAFCDHYILVSYDQHTFLHILAIYPKHLIALIVNFIHHRLTLYHLAWNSGFVECVTNTCSDHRFLCLRCESLQLLQRYAGHLDIFSDK